MLKLFKIQYIEIILFSVYSNLKKDATRGYLGLLWWIFEPILFMGAFYFLFSVGLRRGGRDFAPFLLCGLTAYKWFAANINQGIRSVEANVNIMRQVYLPKHLFLYSIILTNSIKFVIIELMLLVFLVLFNIPINLTWISLPAVILTQFTLVLAISSFIAAIVPFVPDLKFIVENALIFLLFLSGIFFDITKMSEPARFYFYLNPLALLIVNYRKVLLLGAWPDWSALLLILTSSMVIHYAAMKIFHRFDGHYLKIL